jgi:hypothetical protein
MSNNLIFNKYNIRILINKIITNKLYYKKNIKLNLKILKDRMSWEDDDFDVIALMNETQKETQNELQKKQLEERRLVEEADVKLSEELFSKTNKIRLSPIQEPNKIQDISKMQTQNKVRLSPIQTQETRFKPIKPRKQELQELQRLQQKQKKIEKKRLTETFGEADIDVYDELYGDIADRY